MFECGRAAGPLHPARPLEHHGPPEHLRQVGEQAAPGVAGGAVRTTRSVCAWSPDGSRLAAAAVSGPITVFDAATGKPVHELAGPRLRHRGGSPGSPGATCSRRPGRTARCGSGMRRPGQEAKALDAGASWAEKLAWHPSGQWLADRRGEEGAGVDRGRRTRPRTAAAGRHGDGHRVAAGDEPPHAARLRGGDHVRPAQRHRAGASCWRGRGRRWRWRGRRTARSSPTATRTRRFTSGTTTPRTTCRCGVTARRSGNWRGTISSRYLATGGGPVVCIWDCQAGPKGPEGSQPPMLEGHDEERSAALAYQARGFLLASAGLDGRVFLWQPTNKKGPQVGEFQFPGRRGVGAGVVAGRQVARRRVGRGGGGGVPGGVTREPISASCVRRMTQWESSCGRTWGRCWSSGRGSAAGGSPAGRRRGTPSELRKCLDAGDSPPRARA